MENITGLPTTGVDFCVAEVIIFHSWREFFPTPPTPFSSVGLPLPFHPSGVCVGGIKVVLLSSKLQISFASVHLTLRFITVARGATRFGSPLPQSNNSYQLLFHSSPLSATLLLPPLRVGVRMGRGGYFHGAASIFLRGLYRGDWHGSRDVQHMS